MKSFANFTVIREEPGRGPSLQCARSQQREDSHYQELADRLKKKR